MEILKILGMLLMLAAVAAAGAALAAFVHARRSAGSAARAWGRVTELEPREGVDRPVVRFETDAGETVTFRSSLMGQAALFAVGQRVAVYYDRADPGEAELAPASPSLRLAGRLLAAAITFAATGAVLLFAAGAI